MKMKQSFAIAVAAVLVASSAGTAQTQPTPDQIVASLKQNAAESQKRLRQYEWKAKAKNIRVLENSGHRPLAR